MSLTGNVLSTLVNVASEIKTIWQTLGDHNQPVASIISTADYGWSDLIAGFVVKGSGVTDPAWGVVRDGLEGYLFSATAMRRILCDFHLGHDIALGTVLYPHVHWCPVTTATGTVRWGIEYSVAKGHQQGAASVFGPSTTVYVEQTVSAASQYQHFIAEVSLANAIPATNIEPDSVIKMRVFRDAAHANDTFPDSVHAWQADLHYQVARITTKNKAPNFYV